MKTKWTKRLFWMVVLALPLGLFWWSRAIASWRPQQIAKVDNFEIAALSSDERSFAITFPDESGAITVYDLHTGRQSKELMLRREIYEMEFSPNARSMAVLWIEEREPLLRVGISLCNLDGQPANRILMQEYLMEDNPKQLRFSPDGLTVWLVCARTLRAWDVPSGRLKYQWRTHQSRASFADISSDGKFYFRCDNITYSVWDVATKKQLLSKKLAQYHDAVLNFSPDASLMHYRDEWKEEIVFMDTRTGRELWRADVGEWFTLANDTVIVENQDNWQVRDARTGQIKRALTAIPATNIISATHDWLYTINDQRELFRQRLR